MNRKLLVLGLALLIVGLVALPLASAQFGGGDSDNNDDSTDSTDDSDSTSDSDSTDDSDSTSDSDSTDDSDYDGGDAENNEDETSDTDTSDNETTDTQSTDDSDSSDNETSYEGGDSENNEEENSTETDYDGGDAENNDNETNYDGGDSENNDNETSFDGGDAENNENETDDQQENTTTSEDDTSEDQNTDPDSGGSDNTESGQDDGDEDSSSNSPDSGSDEDDSDGGGFSPTNYIIEAVSQSSLEAEVDPDTIQIGEKTTVSGSLTGDDISNKQIEILINGQKYATFTNEEGKFEKEITPTTVGTKNINIRNDDLEETLSLKVTPTVRISSMHTSLEKTPGEPIDVCADIVSQTDAELTLHHNDQTHNSKNGQGELCFEPTLENGDNRFRAVAVVEGDKDEEEITRSINPQRDEPTTLGPSTGSFLSSTTGIVAGIGIITVIISGIAARKRGINISTIFR